MIKTAVYNETDIDIDKIMIVPVSDVDVHRLWTAHVRTLVPKFDIVFSNDPVTISLFKSDGMAVEEPPLLDRGTMSATNVRDWIENDGAWKALVPSTVADYIISIGGVERLKTIAMKETH